MYLYISFVRMMSNSQNGSEGFQNLTIANLQSIERAVSSIMYLKKEEVPKF
jgi:hypothetical protein